MPCSVLSIDDSPSVDDVMAPSRAEERMCEVLCMTPSDVTTLHIDATRPFHHKDHVIPKKRLAKLEVNHHGMTPDLTFRTPSLRGATKSQCMYGTPTSPLPDIQASCTTPNSPLCTHDEACFEDESTTYPHPPDHEQPKSAPVTQTFKNRKSRRKKDKSRDKTRSRKKKGHKGSGDSRSKQINGQVMFRRVHSSHPTCAIKSNEGVNHNGIRQEVNSQSAILDKAPDNRSLGQNFYRPNLSPILCRSTTSLAFVGPGYALSPSGGGGGGLLSPRQLLADCDNVVVSGVEDDIDGSSVAETPLRLPNISPDNIIQSRNNLAAPCLPNLHKSSSNPEITPASPQRRHTSDVTRRTSTSQLTQSTDVTCDAQDNDKKRRQVALLVAIKPENQDAEREKFFKQKYNYEPQFTYKYPANPAALDRFTRPTRSLLPVAEKIMTRVIQKYGSFENFVEVTGGKKLNRVQIVEAAKKYLKKEKMLEEVSVRLSEDILSRACMTRIRGQPTLQVRTNEIREFWMDGLLRHEIGTHFIRSSNNRCQDWNRWRRRRDLNMLPFNPTEEGIAALHSVLKRPEPSMFRSALLYYTAYKASELSFTQLFKDLCRYVKDPHVRWDYCMRAKRGQSDTAQPGTFSKDQVYLTGALSILRHRANIDFHALIRCGKVDFRDVDRLKDLADLENTRIPGFMANLNEYRRHLDDIVIKNGLTEEDLAAAT